MEMGNKKFIGIAAGVIVIVTVVALSRRSAGPSWSGLPPASPPPEAPITRTAAPPNTVVPEKGTAVPANVAAPQNVTPLNPHTSDTNRDFNIKAENNKFTPDTIIVHAGDNININFTAVDKNYDFSQPDYGYGNGKFLINKGQTIKVSFQVTASGKFMFYCALCGGPKSGPIGYIIAP